MDAAVERIVTQTLEVTPTQATHWSTRAMGHISGVSSSTLHRSWRAFGLQPHRTETFKLSAEPLFIEKVRDIVGLYLQPPDKALVLCVDEKAQIQALDPTRPLLPMRLGQVERRTHDYQRHGTTSFLPPWKSKQAASLGNSINGIGHRSPTSSSIRLRRMSPHNFVGPVFFVPICRRVSGKLKTNK